MSMPMSSNIAPPNSLVKYASPMLVSTSGKRNVKDKREAGKKVP